MKIILFLFTSLFFLFCFNTNKKNVKQIIQSKQNIIVPTKISEIVLPENFKRIALDSNSFQFFLRNFPLAKDNTVYYFNGEEKYNQNNQYAVLDIDIGNKDLQQCADAVMRLRAEYLFSKKQYSKIHFNFLSDGKPRYYNTYAGSDHSYKTFRKYMNYIFCYANTSSLYNEMKKVEIKEMQIGDVFIQKGKPYGHAIIVVDMAVNINTGEKLFLIAQSFMPAQSIHILKNFNNTDLSPWYSLEFGQELYTPEWPFTKDDLRRFD